MIEPRYKEEILGIETGRGRRSRSRPMVKMGLPSILAIVARLRGLRSTDAETGKRSSCLLPRQPNPRPGSGEGLEGERSAI